jgi:hypothetical protein
VKSKVLIALSPLAVAALLLAQGSEEVCAHPDGEGPTLAVDADAVERSYRRLIAVPRDIERADPRPVQRVELPACRFRGVRRASIEPVPDILVGREFTFGPGREASEELLKRLGVRCATSRVKILRRDQVEIEER